MAFTDVLTTELNGLTSTSGTAVGPVFDNTAAGTFYMFADLLLDVTFGSAPVAGEMVDVYAVPALDGTNYADGSSTVFPDASLVASIPVRAVTTQQRIWHRQVILPPAKVKFIAVNRTSQSFPASGSKLSILPYGQSLT